ncbi:hypothetical protein BDZ89DRAFT_277155 [Hymenopellis radicata]|nr:hypothetical protein BDZ89DRAFT_277155 [Hymenopellis radicata]
MAPSLVPLVFKSWIKIFAHLEFYGNAPEGIYELLLPMFDAAGMQAGEVYAPVLSAVPFRVVIMCIHNIMPVLRNAVPSSDGLTAPLMFLTATSLSATPFRGILFRHGALVSVVVLLRRLIRNRIELSKKEQQLVPSCITFLQLSVSESEHWLYELLRMGFLEILIRCHNPADSDANVTALVNEMIGTVTVHCTNPDVFRRVQRTMRTISVNLEDLPLVILRSWGVLEDTVSKLAPFMAKCPWRQFRVCSYPQCQKGSCKSCCSRCQRNFYCSPTCQKADLARHRTECLEIAQLHRCEGSFAF